jgi:hypothetical protein
MLFEQEEVVHAIPEYFSFNLLLWNHCFKISYFRIFYLLSGLWIWAANLFFFLVYVFIAGPSCLHIL